MSEAQEMSGPNRESAPNTPETPQFDWGTLGPDFVLQALVDLANVSSISIGVSLNVDGFIVSGSLASGRAYFDGVASEMAAAITDSPEASESMRKYFSTFGDIYDAIPEGEERKLPIYIHLKDAKFFHNAGKPVPGNRGVWWRGRISRVSGFILGTLSTS